MKHTLAFAISLLFFFTSKAQYYCWAHPFTGSGDVLGKYIKTDNSGNLYMSAYSWGNTVDCDPGPGTQPLIGTSDFFVKMDTAGHFQWGLRPNHTNSLGVFNIGYFAYDYQGNVYITGTFGDTLDVDPGTGISNITSPDYSTNAFVLKITNSGNLIWAKSFNCLTTSGICDGRGIAVDNAGNILITGSFIGTVDFDPGPSSQLLTSTDSIRNLFLCKLDPNGNWIWTNTLSDTSVGTRLQTDQHNNIYLQGLINSYNTLVFRSDPNGNILWTRTLGSNIQSALSTHDMRYDSRGNLYFAGSFSDSIDFNPDTNAEFWLNSDTTWNYDNDAFLLKLDTLGHFIWVKQFTGENYQANLSVDIDAYGNIYTFGSFGDTADFDPGPGTHYLYPVGGSDVALVKLDSMGNLIVAHQIAGSWDEMARSISIDSSGNIYTTGTFLTECDFDPGTGVDIVYATNFDLSVFVAKYASPTPFLNVSDIDNNIPSILLYPNPTGGAFTVSSKDKIEKLWITDAFGRKVVMEDNLTERTFSTDILVPGFYTVTVVSANRTSTGKLLIK